MRQRTIAEKISCTGIGLHSGAPVEFTLQPGRIDSGIVFSGQRAGHPVEVAARPEFVVATRHATSLGARGFTVGTVEHLLAALYGIGIDNVRIELGGSEIPIMDGSAASFVFLIRAAGIYEQPAPRRCLRIRRPVEVVDGVRRIRVEPARSFRVSYAIDFSHPAIARQSIENLELGEGVFERKLCRARTFGFLHEVQALWRAGLARGGSLNNTVVLDERRVLNPEGLRMPDEFVRHKVLDLLGDLALLGMPIQGHVKVERGGHALHQRLIAELLSDPSCYEIVTGPRHPAFYVDAPARLVSNA
ncbi:MAG TPA: UDP-3-O-acyl-N-acetylglucosamine deacetylase [Myxococcota bacterium]|nr:UDP-3-O-acyl-N-acetylglucosamine deacetylase [Myxococcota bacterium]